MLSYSNDWYQNFTLKYMSFKITFSGLLPNGRIFTTTEKYINTRKLTFVPLMLAIRDRWKPSCWENMIEIQRECLKLAVPGNFPVILRCRAFPWIFWYFLSIGKAGRERSHWSLLVRTISYGPYGWRHMGRAIWVVIMLLTLLCQKLVTDMMCLFHMIWWRIFVIGHLHLKLVANTNCLQHRSQTSIVLVCS